MINCLKVTTMCTYIQHTVHILYRCVYDSFILIFDMHPFFFLPASFTMWVFFSSFYSMNSKWQWKILSTHPKLLRVSKAIYPIKTSPQGILNERKTTCTISSISLLSLVRFPDLLLHREKLESMQTKLLKHMKSCHIQEITTKHVCVYAFMFSLGDNEGKKNL